MYNLLGFVGFSSCGKDTVANILISKYEYQPIAFADSIKDCLASIFLWDRELLEGHTPESRKWREEVDPWWSVELQNPLFSPRWAMTNFGTDVMREYFNPDIWIMNTRRRLSNRINSKTILKDCRFPNEIAAVRNEGGVIYRIKRGPEPSWYSIAKLANEGDAMAISIMKNLNVHYSEWAWIGTPVDGVIENDSTIEDLGVKVEKNMIYV